VASPQNGVAVGVGAAVSVAGDGVAVDDTAVSDGTAVGVSSAVGVGEAVADVGVGLEVAAGVSDGLSRGVDVSEATAVVVPSVVDVGEAVAGGVCSGVGVVVARGGSDGVTLGVDVSNAVGVGVAVVSGPILTRQEAGTPDCSEFRASSTLQVNSAADGGSAVASRSKVTRKKDPSVRPAGLISCAAKVSSRRSWFVSRSSTMTPAGARSVRRSRTVCS
jgi:hypothetical protein